MLLDSDIMLSRRSSQLMIPGSARQMMSTPNRVVTLRSFASKKIMGRVKCGDALKFMKGLDSDSAGVIFLDPPFNLGKRYAKTQSTNLDRRPNFEYEGWLKSIIFEATRVLRPGGTLYLYHIPKWAIRLGSFLDGSLEFRHWIAISMKNGFARGRRLYPAHYALLMFSKGSPRWFRRPRISPQTCRHCDEYIKDYGGYRSIIDQKGLNLSDFWEDLSPLRHSHRKHRESNELPPLLLNRIVEISGAKGLLYVDPFAGTGAGVLAAAAAGMRFACCDILSANCKIICQRLEATCKANARGGR